MACIKKIILGIWASEG